ncbi:UPF0553 protein C9orf64 [Trachymyrmex septentrionalis]|uniref:Queuosine 5'-phosphate N-glycosylase/hydrolase n=1 Tax=Trachymyrmex septentrionalis TaxID=34720 RepID=A0A195F0Q3_9HYME|nr:UPF0553 protein C9orf64 [Trachymyrmex septentrionalis]
MQSKNKHDIDTLQYVASLSKAVSINTKKIKELATEIVAYASRNHLNENFNEVARSYVRLSTEFHPDKDDKRAADWLFVLNTLNFALWTRKNMKEWKVDGFTGYMALCVAIKKAIDDGKPMWDPKFYTKLKVGEMVQIFKGDDNIIMPHILRRLTILQEVGKVLLDRYDGSFANCIKLCKGNSIELMINIHHVFPSYHDVIKYCEREVCLYTKARTLISDIWAYFDKEHELWIEMKGTKHSTIFADYRIFQVFHHFNVLVYNKEFFDLLEKEVRLCTKAKLLISDLQTYFPISSKSSIKTSTLLKDYRAAQVLLHFGVIRYTESLQFLLRNCIMLRHGDIEELQIRCCLIYAIQMVCDKVRKMCAEYTGRMTAQNTRMSHILTIVDNFIFHYQMKNSDHLMETVPFYYIRTTMY